MMRVDYGGHLLSIQYNNVGCAYVWPTSSMCDYNIEHLRYTI